MCLQVQSVQSVGRANAEGVYLEAKLLCQLVRRLPRAATATAVCLPRPRHARCAVPVALAPNHHGRVAGVPRRQRMLLLPALRHVGPAFLPSVPAKNQLSSTIKINKIGVKIINQMGVKLFA